MGKLATQTCSLHLARDKNKELTDRKLTLDFSGVAPSIRPPLNYDSEFKATVDAHIRFRSETYGALGNMPLLPLGFTDSTTNFWVSFEDLNGDTWFLFYTDGDMGGNPGGGVDGTVTRNGDGFTWCIAGQSAGLINVDGVAGTTTVETSFAMTWVGQR